MRIAIGWDYYTVRRDARPLEYPTSYIVGIERLMLWGDLIAAICRVSVVTSSQRGQHVKFFTTQKHAILTRAIGTLYRIPNS